MLKKLVISIFLFSALVGCAATQKIYVDGLPISDHEYVATTPEGLRASFILTRYYNKQFDEESMIYPEHLDIWDAKNRINIEDTEDLILHMKIVNIKRIPITVWANINGQNENANLILYKGKLPRKDLMMRLPTSHRGNHSFEVVIVGNQEELFSVWGQYLNERRDE